jgi:hypothetical protein
MMADKEFISDTCTQLGKHSTAFILTCLSVSTTPPAAGPRGYALACVAIAVSGIPRHCAASMHGNEVNDPVIAALCVVVVKSSKIAPQDTREVVRRSNFALVEQRRLLLNLVLTHVEPHQIGLPLHLV